MAKGKKRKSKAGGSERILRYLVWLLAFLASFLALFLLGYYVGYTSAKKDVTQEMSKKEQQRRAALDKLERTVRQKQNLNKKLEAILKKERKYDVTAAHETQEPSVLRPPVKKPHKTIHKEARLAIIFDDVSFPSQVHAIKSLGIKATMSFFPPSAIHPHTPQLAAKEKFYMIHLPMEAMHFYKEEPYTLRVGQSEAQIEKRIRSIRKLFPRVHYINNHTGSKFTADRASVKRLIRVLDRNHIHFIDSRTTAKTQVPFVMKQYGHKYMARDVFLDHNGDIESIKKQIALAVKLAKRDGECIAIGHPHPNTIRALAQSKKLLRQVDLVYVYELYR